MEKHLIITVSGHVQGVFYRASAREVAEELGIRGFARNAPNGDVYIEVEGEESILSTFTTWCKAGPRLAHVEKVDIQTVPLVGFKKFEVRR
jgi:acylphosphatase